ncbi:GDSL-type esterase/lipase family protein [Methyloligella sp. 2.7D]|uniref:GDSL-type esterase/lipase family protein n=1 Tax=unclassified Methyloligella TaxID=2625955 RepID=UPI00157BBE2F|nr:GDSL-type esterase/lipase family protein [Methyloligella sp. GL2]QKP76761.1 hypothetical protein HT051_04425 [Methyloligella sp. GL2]
MDAPQDPGSNGKPRRGAGRSLRLAGLIAACLGLGAIGFFAVHLLVDGPGDEASFWQGEDGEQVDVSGLQPPEQVSSKAKRKRVPAKPDGSFYGDLRALETAPSGAGQAVSVLHLGDSHIAADRMTGTLRDLLQARFGNAGRGLVMPGFPFPYYKARGVSFEKSGDWTALNSLNEDGVYGVTGVSLTASKPDAKLTLTAEKPFASASVELLTGPGQGSAIVTQGDSRQSIATGSESRGIKRVALKGGSSFSIAPAGDGPVTVLGLSTESGAPGLRYVNLGIPGASALTTRRWDKALVRDDIAALSPQLIVLGYGTNEGFQDGLDLDAYEATYRDLLATIRQAAPKATILILGPLDGARMPGYAKYDGALEAPCRPLSSAELQNYQSYVSDKSDALARWFPPPKLAGVRARLKTIAEETGAEYLDLSAPMGGPCGIHRWALAEPRLALPDHVHLSDLGSEKVGQAVFDTLMAGYETYKAMPASPGAKTSAITSEDGAAPSPSAEN